MQHLPTTSLTVTQNSNGLPQLPRSQPPGTPPTGEDWGLPQYLQMLQRRWLVIATVGLAAISFFIGSALTKQSQYQGRFRLLVEPANSTSGELTNLTGTGSKPNQELDYDTQIQVLQSPDLINRTVKQLQPVYPQVSYGSIISGLSIARVGKTKLLEVRYKANDSAEVRAVLEQLSKDYLGYSSNERQTDLNQGLQFVDAQLASAQQRVDELQKELQVFRQNNDFFDPDSQAAQISTQSQQLKQERLKLGQEINQTRAVLGTLQAESGAVATLNTAPTYQQLVGQLRQIESQIASERTRFQDKNLSIQVLKNKRDNLIPLLQEEAQRVVGGKTAEIVTQMQILDVQQQSIAQVQQNLSQQFQQLPILSREYTDLQRELKIATDSLNRFLVTRETLQIESAKKKISWQIVEPPTQNPALISGSIQQDLIVGVAASIALGIGAALLLEKLDGTYHTLESLSRSLKLPVLGNVPHQPALQAIDGAAHPKNVKRLLDWAADKSSPELTDWLTVLQSQTSSHETSEFQESLRVLRANIQRLNLEKPIRSFVISSAAAGDGKSTIALFLAKTAAEMGQKVLLVDADLRHSQSQSRLNLATSKGLSDLVFEDLPLTDVIQQPLSGVSFFVLQGGESLFDPARVLSAPNLHRLIERLNQSFDLVIYDAPPLSGLADAILLAPHTGGIILVVRLGKTDRADVTKTLDNLRMSEIPTLGIVGNGAYGLN